MRWEALILAQANLAGDGKVILKAVNMRPASVPMTSAALPAIEALSALIQTTPGGHQGERL
jgi:hypothetical protein